jgi:helix-turn-helix protein
MSQVSPAKVLIASAYAQRLLDNTTKIITIPAREIENTQNRDQSIYPLFETMLRTMGLALKPAYTCQDVATLFGVTALTIQSRVADGTLPSRKLIGRGRFLPKDLEDYLRNAGRCSPE